MKHIRILAGIIAVQTMAWIVLMALSSAEIQPDWQASDYLAWSARGGVAYTLNYINVSLLTLEVVVLFSFLHEFLRSLRPWWALGGLLMVPIYGMLNLLAYSSQIRTVPMLAARALEDGQSPDWVAELIQANPASMVGYANGLAYAILGIPSIIYGVLLIRKAKPYAGWLLLVNGAMCLLGILGYYTGNELLGMGLLAGGVVFLCALLAMVREFRAAPTS